MIGNREVTKRYVGNKLVWKKKSTLETIALENVETKLHRSYIGFTDISNLQKFRGKYVLKIRVNDAQPIEVESWSQELEVTSYYIYINHLSSGLRRYFVDNGINDNETTQRINITFYLKE